MKDSGRRTVVINNNVIKGSVTSMEVSETNRLRHCRIDTSEMMDGSSHLPTEALTLKVYKYN